MRHAHTGCPLDRVCDRLSPKTQAPTRLAWGSWNCPRHWWANVSEGSQGISELTCQVRGISRQTLWPLFKADTDRQVATRADDWHQLGTEEEGKHGRLCVLSRLIRSLKQWARLILIRWNSMNARVPSRPCANCQVPQALVCNSFVFFCSSVNSMSEFIVSFKLAGSPSVQDLTSILPLSHQAQFEAFIKFSGSYAELPLDFCFAKTFQVSDLCLYWLGGAYFLNRGEAKCTSMGSGASRFQKLVG
jgi:hypothetical protein